MGNVYVTAGEVRWFTGPKIQTDKAHGCNSGSSVAIIAGLALGVSSIQAVEKAKRFITHAIAHVPDIGGIHGPTNRLVWLEMGDG